MSSRDSARRRRGASPMRSSARGKMPRRSSARQTPTAARRIASSPRARPRLHPRGRRRRNRPRGSRRSRGRGNSARNIGGSHSQVEITLGDISRVSARPRRADPMSRSKIWRSTRESMKKTATVEKKRNEGERARGTKLASRATTPAHASARHAWRRAIRLEPPRHDDRGEEGCPAAALTG